MQLFHYRERGNTQVISTDIYLDASEDQEILSGWRKREISIKKVKSAFLGGNSKYTGVDTNVDQFYRKDCPFADPSRAKDQACVFEINLGLPDFFFFHFYSPSPQYTTVFPSVIANRVISNTDGHFVFFYLNLYLFEQNMSLGTNHTVS